ncbi:MAG TPA: hypothetical protein PLD82_02715 [Spirochaetota bacterium]|nr:hypothetical protein [Spirochaetota bacterium]HPH02918.1 hypothetical protein [Spirochaetota bacterium]
MRRVLTAISVLFAVSTSGYAFATDAGSWSFAGEISLETGYGAAWDSMRISGSPSLSWFFADCFAVKGSLWFERQEIGKETAERGGGYLGVDWYFRGPASPVFPFVGVSVGGGRFAWGETSVGYAGLRVDAGMVFLFNETIGIRLLASWFRDTVDTQGRDATGGRLLLGAGVHLFLF